MKHNQILFSLFGSETLTKNISEYCGYSIEKLYIHQYPDQESLITIPAQIKNQHVILIAYFNKPNEKILPFLFAARTARSLGAARISLVAPYLPYMRQDTRFHEGEGISSVYFAEILEQYIDDLITVDPHLHRWKSLNDIYSINCVTLHACQAISIWIREYVKLPVLIGPDLESEQWIAEIAALINAPYFILTKKRIDDTHVKEILPNISDYHQYQPIIIDDIISSGNTIIETIKIVKSLNLESPYCIGVHALFDENTYKNIISYQPKSLVTCNSILHETNRIDLSGILSHAIKCIS